MRAIIDKRGCPVSWLTIAKDYDIASHKTVKQYAQLLQELFVAKILYYIDPNKGVINYMKDKKIHLQIHFSIILSLSGLYSQKITDFSYVIEGIVATHLARKFPVFYWKNRREIDIVMQIGEKLIGFEVHYTDRIRETTAPVIGKIKEIVFLFRGVYEDKPPTVPVCAFLACLDLPQLIETQE